MKKLIICLTTVLLLTTLSSNQVMAASRPATTSTATPGESAAIHALITRLNEIKAMDKSTLSHAEKKELRKEVRSTKEALRDHGHGGIYISGAALVIIIILLIILL